MAKLFFRYGPMNSGKTTALLQVAHNYEERGMTVLIMKPSTDTKGASSLVSRIGASRPADIVLEGSNQDLTEIVKAKNPHCVLVDEAQFLSPEQVDDLFRIVVDQGIPVIAYGLRTDFRTRLFPGSQRLFELAHSIEELKTICRCGKKAILNARFIEGKFVSEGSQVAIDESQGVSYEAKCGTCYRALNKS
jgi:thymidine kinase